MSDKINLVIVGVDQSVLDKQLAMLSLLDASHCKLMCTVAFDQNLNLSHLDENTILVVNLTQNGLEELAFIENLVDKKVAIIIIGDQSNISLLSQALRFGVKDFIDFKTYQDQFLATIETTKKNIIDGVNSIDEKCINVIVNAKGGSGASFIACNVAFILANESKEKVALLDLDMQFGTIGLYFDRSPQYKFTEVLHSLDDLDAYSLEAYISKYNQNLSLVLPSPSEVSLPGEVDVKQMLKLLELLKVNYGQIVIDIPRLIDPVSNIVMQRANHITLVVQQSLGQFRDAKRWIQILNKELDIPLEKIILVINRYDSSNTMRISDLKEMINHDGIYTICNDFERVAKSSDIGIPLYESFPDAKIAKDLKVLASCLSGIKFKKPKKNIFNLFGLIS